MIKVKICGITDLSDALAAVGAGADMLGFNFCDKSPRFVSPQRAGAIVDVLPPSVKAVGVFVNESGDKVAEIASLVGLNSLQLHGDESPDYAWQLASRTGLEIIKALRPSPGFGAIEVMAYRVDAILLDAYSSTAPGGTGRTIDWALARECAALVSKFFLAGGLAADNVAQAVAIVRPYAVDACSRLESRPGKKDAAKMERFIAAAKGTI
jgi:phosphoribosylanthranilate isomerase